MQKTADKQIDLTPVRPQKWGGTIAVCGVAIVCLLLLWLHNPIVNGSPFHRWPWRSLSGWRVYPVTLLACAPLAAAQIFWRRKGLASIAAALVLLMLTNISLQILDGALREDRYDLERIVDLVHNPAVTSYYTEAVILATQGKVLPFLADYPQLMAQFHMHATQKPPGQILYWYAWLLITQDGGGSALFGAFGLALLTSLSIPATYWLARTIFEGSDDAATIAAIASTLLALSPSMVLYFPLFDSVYPAMTCAALATWLLALRTHRVTFAVLCGLIFAAMFFLSFIPLTLGVAVVGYALAALASRATTVRVAVRQAVIVLSVIALVYLSLWIRTRYNTIQTFRVGMHNERAQVSTFEIPRTYPHTIPTDVLDFFAGSAWVTFPPLLFWMMRRKAGTEHNWLLLAGLLQIVVIAAGGLLRSETARLWTFMLPLALVPVATEVARWSPRQRAIVFVAMWLLLSATMQNLEVH